MNKLTIIIEEEGEKIMLEVDTSHMMDYNQYLQAMINVLRGTGRVVPEEEDRA